MDMYTKDMKKILVDENEEIVAVLGNSYVESFLATGSAQKGYAVVTNKRVYFRGNCYYRERKGYKASSEVRTVDLKDVTGTGFINKRYPILKLLTKLMLPLLIVLTFVVFVQNIEMVEDAMLGLVVPISIFSFFNLLIEPVLKENVSKGIMIRRIITVLAWPILFLIGYIGDNSQAYEHYEIFIPAGIIISLLNIILKFISAYINLDMFEIQFAGGGIAFRTHFYSQEEISTFEKGLRKAKDNDRENHMVNNVVTENTQNVQSISDELKKYKELMDEGILSQEEFDEIKKNLISKI